MRLTSKLDYSITKKRLRMSSKRFSKARGYSKSVFMLPSVSFIALLFCASPSPEGLERVELYSNVYSNVDLFKKIEPGSSAAAKILVNADGTPFSGTRQIFLKKDDELIIENYYEDGIINLITTHGINPHTGLKSRGEFKFRDGTLVTASYFYSNDQIAHERLSSAYSANGLNVWKEWYQNGQLKLEWSYDENVIAQGLATSYDEEGNIIGQELYKDGELLEKIK